VNCVAREQQQLLQPTLSHFQHEVSIKGPVLGAVICKECGF